MQPSPHQAELGLCPSEFHVDDAFPERHYALSSIDNTPSTLFKDALNTQRESGTPHGYGHVYSQHFGDTNDPNQSPLSNIGRGAEKHISHHPLSPGSIPRSTPRGHDGLPRGVDKFLGMTCLGTHSLGMGRGEVSLPRESPLQPYGIHRKSFSLTSLASAPMQALPYSPSRHSSAPPAHAPDPLPIKYQSFQGLFKSGQAAKDHCQDTMRFGRFPSKDPRDDPTIDLIEADRAGNVERIYNAMIRGDLARDNEGSTALKRWVYGAYYDSTLVEAYAHKVFDALLEQVKKGFRGWPINDYVVDERKGDDEDRDVDCARRLDNIISALEHEKSICENVMSSSKQIRMFVNAPRAYSKRKDQNRIGNGKRLNSKGKKASDGTPRPSKKRRIGDGQTRAGSATTSDIPVSDIPVSDIPVSDIPVSRGTTPQQLQLQPLPTAGPYYTSPFQQPGFTSPQIRALVSRAPPMQGPVTRAHRQSFGQQTTSAMSPPAMSPHPLSRTPQSPLGLTSIPPAHQSPLSPLTLSHGHISASAPPDNRRSPPTGLPFDLWDQPYASPGPQGMAFIGTTPTSDSLYSQVSQWSQQVPTFSPMAGNVNVFECYPEMGVALSDVERVSFNQSGTAAVDPLLFSDLWDQESSAQVFPFDEPPTKRESEP